jgi:hypothetical protein
MWETVVAGAGGLIGLYIAIRREIRREIRRTYELLEKDIGHLDSRLTQEIGHVGQDIGHLYEGITELRADIRRLDGKIDAVRG